MRTFTSKETLSHNTPAPASRPDSDCRHSSEEDTGPVMMMMCEPGALINFPEVPDGPVSLQTRSHDDLGAAPQMMADDTPAEG